MKKFYLHFIIPFLCILFLTQIDAQQRPDIYNFNAAERLELRQLMMSYITTPVVNQHLLPDPIIGNFHNYMEEFLTWHRAYIGDMEAYLLTQPGGDKFVPLPSWDPTTVIPDEFFNALVPPGSAVASGWSFSTLTNQDPTDIDFSTIFNNLCSYTPSPGKTAIDNFAAALESRHDPVHGAIGGIMGSFQSPAAAIFWLWHAWIDDVYRQYECDCQAIDANDLYTKDSPVDIGNEANTQTGSVLYNSSDIWVRNTQDVLLPNGRYSQEDNPLRHENPEYSALGNPNFVYVKVRNRGCNTMAAGTADLRVYWSKASTGLNWPTHFNSYFFGGILHGDEITAGAPISIPTLAPGVSYVAEIPWNAPNPADFTIDAQHFCLLSRIVSSSDPMTFAEVAAVGTNTRNNNNIAWKNLTVVDLDPLNIVGGGNSINVPFFVRQTFDNPVPMRLVFQWSNFEIIDNLRLELDDNLLELALQSYDVNGIQFSEDENGNMFLELVKDEGSIGDLFLQPGEIYAINMVFEINCEDQETCPPYGTVENLVVEQYLQNDFGDEFIGGNFYELRINQDKETECGDFPIVGVNVENPSCSNTPDGSIKLELEGQEPFDIFWNNGQNSQVIEGLLPGEYKVSVRDAQNCINHKTIVLSDESDLALVFDPTHVTRFCDNLGAVNLSVEGGTPDYKVAWSNGSTSFNLQDLQTGVYIATVTDVNGCERIDSVSINQNFPIKVNTQEIKHTSSTTSNDGEIKITATGGERPLMYSWDNGSNSNELIDLAAGDYIVTISDQRGCNRVDTFTVEFSNSIIEEKRSKLMHLSPNPASDILKIGFEDIPRARSDSKIIVLSIEGKVMDRNRLTLGAEEYILNVKNYPSGTYIVKLVVDDHMYIQKIVKL